MVPEMASALPNKSLDPKHERSGQRLPPAWTPDRAADRARLVRAGMGIRRTKAILELHGLVETAR